MPGLSSRASLAHSFFETIVNQLATCARFCVTADRVPFIFQPSGLPVHRFDCGSEQYLLLFQHILLYSSVAKVGPM